MLTMGPQLSLASQMMGQYLLHFLEEAILISQCWYNYEKELLKTKRHPEAMDLSLHGIDLYFQKTGKCLDYTTLLMKTHFWLLMSQLSVLYFAV